MLVGLLTVSAVFSAVTHHTSCLHSLRHIPGVRLAPEHVTVKALAAHVHDEAKRVHVVADAHEGQEADPTLDQHFTLVLLTDIATKKKR